MADVKHVEIFNCTPEQFFDLLVDYNSYPQFLSDVKGCRVVEEKGDTKIVEYQISVIKSFKYFNEHKETRPSEIRWKFIKGDLFKSMSGYWRLSPEGDKTKAEYYVEAQFGLFVPGAFTKTALSVNLPAMMKSYHQRVKELYGV